MSKRSIIGVVLVLVATLLVAAPAAAEDLSPAQLCDLFPSDQGFAMAPDSATGGCSAKKGDCAQPPGSLATCIDGHILQKATSAEALGLIHSPGGIWSAVPGLGEVSAEACDPFFCIVEFQRDRFWVSVLTAPEMDLPPGRALAAHVDQEIQRILLGGSAPTPSTDTTSGSVTTSAPPAAAPTPDFGDVFFGNADITALYPDIDRFIECGTLIPSGQVLSCEGARDGLDAQFGAAVILGDLLTSPSQTELDGARVWTDALLLAGLKGYDGGPLFPSVRGALPLIERLPDARAARRFLEMLAAMDAAVWEDRL